MNLCETKTPVLGAIVYVQGITTMKPNHGKFLGTREDVQDNSSLTLPGDVLIGTLSLTEQVHREAFYKQPYPRRSTFMSPHRKIQEAEHAKTSHTS